MMYQRHNNNGSRICSGRLSMQSVMNHGNRFGDMTITKQNLRISVPESLIHKDGKVSAPIEALLHKIASDKPEIIEKLNDYGIICEIVA